MPADLGYDRAEEIRLEEARRLRALIEARGWREEPWPDIHLWNRPGRKADPVSFEDAVAIERGRDGLAARGGTHLNIDGVEYERCPDCEAGSTPVEFTDEDGEVHRGGAMCTTCEGSGWQPKETPLQRKMRERKAAAQQRSGR